MNARASVMTSTGEPTADAVVRGLAVRAIHELAHRVNGGIEVTLYWSAVDDSTFIEVWQSASDETIGYPVAREQALDAFYHPFAHLPTSPN
jgi:hypothetical protein